MAASHAWAFRASFRRNAFGWSGTRKAIERLNEAAGEIERMARTDPALAGEGAVLLLEKLSPNALRRKLALKAHAWEAATVDPDLPLPEHAARRRVQTARPGSRRQWAFSPLPEGPRVSCPQPAQP